MTLAEYRKEHGEPPLDHKVHLGAHEHPGAMEYAQIGGILAIITALEVGLYYINMAHSLLVTILIIMSFAKFSLVVMWFMHLRFDNRLFSIFFVGGMALTFSIFAVVIAALRGQLV